MTGGGDPVTGTSTRIGSPARTFISRPANLLRSNFGASAHVHSARSFIRTFIREIYQTEQHFTYLLIGSFVLVHFYLLRLFNFSLLNLFIYVVLPYTMVK